MTTYFISSTGNAANPGTKPLPWASIKQFNDLASASGVFAGDIILFERGGVWDGQTIDDTIQLRNFTGEVGNWVIFSTYGSATAANPKFLGTRAFNEYGVISSFVSWDDGPTTIPHNVAFFDLDGFEMGSTDKNVVTFAGLNIHHMYVNNCNCHGTDGTALRARDGATFCTFEDIDVTDTGEEAVYIGNLESVLGEWTDDCNIKNVTVDGSILEGIDVKKAERLHLEDFVVSNAGALLPNGNDSMQISGNSHNIIRPVILRAVDDVSKGAMYLSARDDYPAHDITVWDLKASNITGNTGASAKDNGCLRVVGASNNKIYNSEFTNATTGSVLGSGLQGLANAEVLGVTLTNVATEKQGSPSDITYDASPATAPAIPVMPSIGEPANPEQIDPLPVTLVSGPAAIINVISLVGDLKRGGWVAKCRLDNDIDLVAAGDSVAFSAKSVFSPTEFQPYFNGTVVSNPDGLTFTRLNSSVSFQVATVDTLLSGESVQAIGFTEQETPANDHQILSPMLLSDIVEHILRKHANPVFDATTNTDGIVTVLNLLSAESVNLARYNTQKSNNFWGTLQKIGGGETAGEFYRPFFNRKNEFFYQPAPFFLPSPPASKGTIDKRHIWGTVKIRFNNNQPSARLGQVQLASIKDFETVFKSQFPLSVGNGKILQRDSGIYASSQAESDRNAERLFKWLTRDYTLTIDVDPALVLFGEDGNGLDLSDKVHVTYDGPVEDSDTGSGMTLDIDNDFFIYGASVTMSNDTLRGVGTLVLEIDNI